MISLCNGEQEAGDKHFQTQQKVSKGALCEKTEAEKNGGAEDIGSGVRNETRQDEKRKNP